MSAPKSWKNLEINVTTLKQAQSVTWCARQHPICNRDREVIFRGVYPGAHSHHCCTCNPVTFKCFSCSHLGAFPAGWCSPACVRTGQCCGDAVALPHTALKAPLPSQYCFIAFMLRIQVPFCISLS